MDMESEIIIARIYVSEGDHGRRTNLHAGNIGTSSRPAAGQRRDGFPRDRRLRQHHGEVHAADALRLMVDLPLVIEFFDEPAVVQAALGLLSGTVPDGRIVWWRATCR